MAKPLLFGFGSKKYLTPLNMNEQGRDVEKFLFNPKDVRRVTLFAEIIKQAEL